MGNEFGISWHQFRSQYIKFGGDGIYAAAKLLHQEPVFNKNKIGRCFLNCRKKHIFYIFFKKLNPKSQKY